MIEESFKLGIMPLLSLSLKQIKDYSCGQFVKKVKFKPSKTNYFFILINFNCFKKFIKLHKRHVYIYSKDKIKDSSNIYIKFFLYCGLVMKSCNVKYLKFEPIIILCSV